MRAVRLIHHQGLVAPRARRKGGQPWGLVGRRSEVKEETAAARPSSGDMSAGGHPSLAARAAAPASGIPTGYAMIRDFKTRIYGRETGYSSRPTNPPT